MCNQYILNTITQKIINEAKADLGEKLDKIILYGSYARGDYDNESDIDIIILADIPAADTDLFDAQLIKHANRLGLKYDVVISIFIKDCGTFYKYLPAEPFYQNVLNEGVLLSA